MGNGTSVGRVRGLGSAHEGSQDWWHHKISAGSNLILMLWFLLSMALLPAHDLLTRILVAMRLMSPNAAEPPAPARAAIAQACGQADWAALLAALDVARQSVGEAWRRIAAQAGVE